MKKYIVYALFASFNFVACKDVAPPLDCCYPLPSYETTCIKTKINAISSANKDFTSVKRYKKGNDFFWLFDNGSAFDAPQYMLNAACDTVCTWEFRASNLPCKQDFNLNDSTAVVVWRK